MHRTGISWAEYTCNPILARNTQTGAIGHYCQRVSAGCTNCYAAAFNRRVRPVGDKNLIGTGVDYTADGLGKLKLYLDEHRLAAPMRKTKRARIFWCSMTDLFGEFVPLDWIARCLGVMVKTRQHDHIVLTKRADRMASLLRSENRATMSSQHGWINWRQGDPPEHIWFGVTVESRAAWWRVDELRRVDAAVRWISAEPLLEDLELTPADLAGIHWIVIGGESGTGARTCRIEWIEAIIEVARAAGTKVFVKQLGKRPTRWGVSDPMAPFPLKADPRAGTKMEDWPESIRIQEYPE